MCGALIGPLLLAHPVARRRVTRWTRHRNLWVRRASAVSLVRLAHAGVALDDAYDVARRCTATEHDLIHKAVGWLLREAGKADPARLERYLLRQRPEHSADDGALRDRAVSAGERSELLRGR